MSIIIYYIGKIAWYREEVDIDSQYLDEDGDHVYYERSLIEKKEFRRKHPDINNLRTIRSLFWRIGKR